MFYLKRLRNFVMSLFLLMIPLCVGTIVMMLSGSANAGSIVTAALLTLEFWTIIEKAEFFES